MPTLLAPAPDDVVELWLACHARIRQALADCQALGEGRGGSPQALSAARYFEEALPRHVEDEDLTFGPRLVAIDPSLATTVAHLQSEHDGHRLAIQDLALTLRALAAAPEHRGARHAVGTAWARIGPELLAHLDDEERWMLPGIRALTSGERALALVELRARRTRG